MKNFNSACHVVSLQSKGTAPETVRDSDLIINLSSDAQSCDNSESDIDKTFLPNPYNFEQDIEKLIKVSKQFQTDYENEKVESRSAGEVDDTDNLNIQILTSNSNSLRRQSIPASEVNLQANDVDDYYFSNCSSRKENILSLRSSQRNKRFTPKLPNVGPFGTGIIRPSPKKHSCVKKSDATSVKQSHRVGWNVRPYTARYYDFDRAHPDLKLVENGGSIIPKRICKLATKMAERARSESDTRKPLLNRGLTWHEFFERSNVYSARSVQSSYGDVQTHITSTQASGRTPSSKETNKIQKHILPQLNIRAECSVQRIPEISIAPNGFKPTVQSNIKLVEIVYEDVETVGQQSARAPAQQSVDSFEKDQIKIIEKHEVPVDLEFTSLIDLESTEINVNAKLSESKISSTTSSKTSSENNGYDSSLEESISLNVSRVSTVTSALTDHERFKKSLKDTGVQTHNLALTDLESFKKPIKHTSVQTQKLKRFAKHRKDIIDQKAIKSSSDYSEFEYDGKHLPHLQEVRLPTFPTNELIQMVDEIFDTSSDAVNMSYKYVVKETSVQTDIVWENINQLFKHQSATTEVPTAAENQFPQLSAEPQSQINLPSNFVNAKTEQRHFFHGIPSQNNYSNGLLHRDSQYEGYCRHTHLKKFKICSCVACKSNVRFSAVNINQSSSGTSSSSAVIDYPKPIPGAKIKMFPSVRYKQMKQAQREHFQNDPRISKTLKRIYETAKTIKSRHERTSSSSSGDRCHLNNLSSCDDEVPQPDLYTFDDEMLLFGFGRSSDEVQYSSHLLKTESSQDTFASNDRYCGMDTSNERFLRNQLMCTNSEDSSGNSFLNKRASDLERCLMKDIENSGSDPAVLSLVSTTSSLERRINEIQLHEPNSIPEIT